MNYFKKLFERKETEVKPEREAKVEQEKEERVITSPFADKNNMLLIEGGIFIKGGKDDGSLTQSVAVGNYMIGKYEVAQELWESVMGSNPSYFKGNRRPVENISWHDVVKFCNNLSEKEGLQKAYKGGGDNITCNFDSNGYRLPTEAEWEYAARGGNKSEGYKYSGSNDIEEVAWYPTNSGWETHDVGSKKPNELGIYDMSGNVWEWCWDWYAEYNSGNQKNPRGPSSGSHRVVCGGSWVINGVACSVDYRRASYVPVYRGNDLGLRLARTKL